MRLFVALELPGAARDEIYSWSAETLLPDPAVRVVPAANLHVTLVFLGWRGEDEVATIARAALEPVHGLAGPLLEPEGVSGVPPRRPRLFAVDLADPSGGAEEIQGTCERALAQAGHHEPEDRPFWAHVTVARARRRERPRRLGSGAPPGGSFVAPAVVLYRSDMSRDGARYTALERVELAT